MSWWKTAKPGDKIVCVNADPNAISLYLHNGEMGGLAVGEIYTVSEISPNRPDCPARGSNIRVLLVEINRSISEPGFSVERFRPVQPKSTETGMKMLRKLLTNKKARVRAC